MVLCFQGLIPNTGPRLEDHLPSETAGRRRDARTEVILLRPPRFSRCLKTARSSVVAVGVLRAKRSRINKLEYSVIDQVMPLGGRMLQCPGSWSARTGSILIGSAHAPSGIGGAFATTCEREAWSATHATGPGSRPRGGVERSEPAGREEMADGVSAQVQFPAFQIRSSGHCY